MISYLRKYATVIGFIIFLGFMVPISIPMINIFGASTKISFLTPIQPFTAVFLHLNGMHWLTNSIYLLIIMWCDSINKQQLSHPILGIIMIGALDNLFAIVATLAYNLPTMVIIGASGGIFGLLGYVLINNLITLYYKPRNKNIYIALILLLTVIYVVLTSNPNITSNIVHLTGLTIGSIAAIYKWQTKKTA